MVNLLIAGVMALDNIRTPFGELRDTIGGAASYAGTAASLFTEVGIISAIGKDMPSEHLEFLKERKIDTSGIEIADGKTMRWDAEYRYDMNEANTLNTELNVFMNFNPRIPDNMKDAEYVLLCPLPPKIQLSIISQLNSPKLVGIDTIKYYIDNNKEELLEVIRKVNVVFLNEGEARQLCDTPNLVKAGRMIQSMGPRTVLIKKGEHGCLLFNESSIFSACAYPLENVKDPTGAGDSFGGSFMGVIAGHGDLCDAALRKAVMYGTAVASYNAEHFCLNKLKALTKEEIEERFGKLKTITEF